MNRNKFLKLFGLTTVANLIGVKTQATLVKKNEVIHFTPEILKAYNVGLYIINDKADVVARPDYSATVSWKLVWHIEVINLPKYGLCNFLTDGWTYYKANTHQEMCNWLNNNPHGEKFRIMTKEELLYMINHRNNIKQLIR